MKILIISYSLTGNNDALATSLAKEFVAEHIKITERKPRTTCTIMLDVIFNRTPSVSLSINDFVNKDLIIFVAPVWMGHIAAPLRAYFKYLKNKPSKYAFVSISGGADGPNDKLAGELSKRVGKEPAIFINMHIADLLPPHPKPTRKDTTAYRLNETEVKSLTNKVVKRLRETMAM
jgi:Flavodoxin-like fold